MFKLVCKHTIWIAISLAYIFTGCKPKTKKIPTPFSQGKVELYGNKGCRGIYPENSLVAFINALKFGVTTLQIDVCVSKDDKVIVTSSPYLKPALCAINKTVNLYQLPYTQIKAINCGTNGDTAFPEQQKMISYIPLLNDVIDSVEHYCSTNKLPIPNYCINFISNKKEYNISQPMPTTFVKLVHNAVNGMGIYIRTTIQSDDPAILKEYKKINPLTENALTVNNHLALLTNIRKAGIMPKVYNPNYLIVTKQIIDSCHLMGIKIVPWVVNDIKKAQELLDLGVDGLVTDYPNRMQFMRK
ncbi:MAG: glycerophosphodiester phosphodiesterase [Bacteroidia bacterium]|nr:glycerophosphodiester phosphodiesterase [Bacteroidia bacterium]